MPQPLRRRADRRELLRLTGLAGLVGVTGCASRRPPRLALATGQVGDASQRLGVAICQVWRAELGLPATPLLTAGSVENLAMLGAGRADVAFCALDVAADGAVEGARPARALQALARVRDDAVQVVVPADSPARRLADLKGLRVSLGARSSSAQVVAPRLLAVAGLAPERDLVAFELGLDDSVDALRRGELDAVLWSGSVPTAGLDALASARPIRLLDLELETAELRRRYSVYATATVPERTYRILEPVTTVSVRNVLLVSEAMDVDLARDLTRCLLDRRDELAVADPSGDTIEARTAIGTFPVDLHAGALAAYRSAKGG